MTLRQLLEQRVSAALVRCGASGEAAGMVGPATRPEFGDYQANGVMVVAKMLKVNPRALAQQVVAALDLTDLGATARVAGPGFINITLGDNWLGAHLKHLLDDKRLGVSHATKPTTVVVDYSSPNLAKEMHVGHLRSTNIGDAIVRVLTFLGHRVVRQNHVGDWGTQFGMLIAYLDWLEEKGDLDISTRLADLEAFYQSARGLFDSDAEFATRARQYVVKLQGGDPHCRAIWQRFTEESLSHCEQVYERLHVTLTHDDVKAESAYNEMLPKVIETLNRQGLLTESEGALCVFLEELREGDSDIKPVIVQKSDGGFLYATTDLAAIGYRASQLNADRVLYVMDARQSLHLQQVFAVARRAGLVPSECSLEHVAFGVMLGEDGRPFRTRSGGTVKLMDLLDEAEARARDLVVEKSPDLPLEERRSIARAVGVSSIKYADLALNRTTDYVFDWDKMLCFNGNTAPYLLYSYTRVCSIFRRAEVIEEELAGDLQLIEPAERNLGLKLAQFADAVEAVAIDCHVNLLCNYLYELAECFMKFYESCPVLKAEASLRRSRLQLSRLTGLTIRVGLDLLGLKTVEKM